MLHHAWYVQWTTGWEAVDNGIDASFALTGSWCCKQDAGRFVFNGPCRMCRAVESFDRGRPSKSRHGFGGLGGPRMASRRGFEGVKWSKQQQEQDFVHTLPRTINIINLLACTSHYHEYNQKRSQQPKPCYNDIVLQVIQAWKGDLEEGWAYELTSRQTTSPSAQHVSWPFTNGYTWGFFPGYPWHMLWQVFWHAFWHTLAM